MARSVWEHDGILERENRPRIIRIACVAIGWPLLVATLVRALLQHAAQLSTPSRASVSALLFLVLACLPFAKGARSAWGLRGQPFAIQLLIAALAFLLMAALLSARRPEFSRFGLSIFVTGAVEEFVFRWVIPVSVMPVLVRPWNATWGRLQAVILAQVSFALAHLVSHGFAPLGVSELTRFFSGGILYASLVSSFGLCAAATIHATMNLTLLDSINFHFGGPSLSSSVLFALLGASFLWRDISLGQGRYSSRLTSTWRTNEISN
jgi:hypothetical protein